MRESLLLNAHVPQLGLQRADVGVALRKLRIDLAANLGEQFIENPLGQHVPRDVVDQRAFDFAHGLVDGHGADGVAAFVMTRARVGLHAFVAAAVRTRRCRDDRTAAVSTRGDAGEWVASAGTAMFLRPVRAKPFLHRAPDVLINDAPLGNVDHERLARVSFHAQRRSVLPDFLNAAMNVHTAIARVQEHRADRAPCPRAATSTTCGRCANALCVQRMRHRLEAHTAQMHLENAPDDSGFGLVHDGNGVLAARRIRPTLEGVAEASTARDPAFANACSQRFAHTRSDGFQLHLMPCAGDECRRLIDRVREQNLLPGRVIEQSAAAVADEIANDERHLDRIASETRLIAAQHDVPALRFGEKLTQASASEEVVARTPIVEVVHARLIGEAHPLDEVVTAFRLHVEAELLLAFVVLRSSAIGSDGHVVLRLSD